MNKILIIDLDGATFDLIGPWVKAGKLPNFSKTMQGGVTANLRSTIPPITPCAYTSFLTGKRPGNHGVFDFYHRARESYNLEIVNTSTKNGIAFWRLLNSHGRKTGFINVPTFFPAEEIDGFIVGCGLLTPEVTNERFVYPKNLFEKHNLDKSKYILELNWESFRYGNIDNTHYAEILKMLNEREKVALKLFKEENWDFFMVHFHAIDWVQHFFWDETDKVLEVHKEIDRIIGEFLNLIDDNTTVIIMSDHGFGPTYKTIHTANWLQKIGLLEIKPIPFQYFLDKSFDYLFYKIFKFSDKNKFISGTKKVVSKTYGLFPGFFKSLLDRLITFVYENVPKIEGKYHVSYTSRFAWSKTKAYAVGWMGQVYVNLKGREPEGIVSYPEEYNEIRDYIRDEYYKLKDEKGQQLIEKVLMKEEIFTGDSSESAPDLIPFNEKNVYYFHPDIEFNDIIAAPLPWRKGNHHPKGIFMIKGPNIKTGKTLPNIDIIDIAPTILYIMGVPISKEMDGKVFKNCLAKEFQQANQVKFLETYEMVHSDVDAPSSLEEEVVKRRLRGLGYL